MPSTENTSTKLMDHATGKAAYTCQLPGKGQSYQLGQTVVDAKEQRDHGDPQIALNHRGFW